MQLILFPLKQNFSLLDVVLIKLLKWQILITLLSSLTQYIWPKEFSIHWFILIRFNHSLFLLNLWNSLKKIIKILLNSGRVLVVKLDSSFYSGQRNKEVWSCSHFTRKNPLGNLTGRDSVITFSILGKCYSKLQMQKKVTFWIFLMMIFDLLNHLIQKKDHNLNILVT